MEEFLIYIVKSAIGLLLFYICFKALLSRDTFFRFNRFILLAGMFICVLLPFVRIEVSGRAKIICDQVSGLERTIRTEAPIAWEEEEGNSIDAGYAELHQENAVLSPGMVGKQPNTIVVAERVQKKAVIPLGILLFVVYLSGAFCVCIWLGIAFFRIRKLFCDNRRENFGKYTLVIVKEKICPFSWGHYIMINENDYNTSSREILTHEKIHADKKHSWDLCFTELLLIIQWFNPAIWLLKKELQDIHEYEADNGVINQGIDATKYQLLLVKKAVGARLYSIANSFNHSKLKNRITMMLKEKSNRWARFKVLLLLPPAALLMLAFARPGEGIVASPKNFKVMQIPEKNEKWTEQFLAEEKSADYSLRQQVVENDLPQEEMSRKQMYDKYGKRWVQILVTKYGMVHINFKMYPLKQVYSVLVDMMKEHLSWKPLFITLQPIHSATAENMREVMEQVEQAYKEVRAFAATQSNDKSEEYLNKVCPVMIRTLSASQEFNGDVFDYRHRNAKRPYFSDLSGFKDLIVRYSKQDSLFVRISYDCRDIGEARAWLKQNGYKKVAISHMMSRGPKDWPVMEVRWEGPRGAAEYIQAWNLEDLEYQLKMDKRYKKVTSVYLRLREKNDQLKSAATEMLKEYGVTEVKGVTPPPPPPVQPISVKLFGGQGLLISFAVKDLESFKEKLAELGTLEKYTGCELTIKKPKADDLKNQLIKQLEGRGIKNVKVVM